MAKANPNVNKRWKVTKFTHEAKQNLQLVEEGVPALAGDEEALVRLQLRPVNPSDLYTVQARAAGEDVNSLSLPPLPLPFVPGLEGLGVVEELGSATSGRVKKGQRVVGRWPARTRGEGSWQQYVSAPEKDLIPVPDGVSDQAAAQFLVNPVTAWGLLDAAGAPQGEWLLSNAAGSVLGRILIALARKRGVKTLNVVRRSEQKQELLDLGADAVVATDKEDLVKRADEITGGKGVYAAFDALAGVDTGVTLRTLRPRGTLFVYGALTASYIKADVGTLLAGERHITAFYLPGWLEDKGPAGAAKEFQAVWEAFLDGTIQPYTGEVFPLEKAVEALEASTRVARGGKVLLEG